MIEYIKHFIKKIKYNKNTIFPLSNNKNIFYYENFGLFVIYDNNQFNMYSKLQLIEELKLNKIKL